MIDQNLLDAVKTYSENMTRPISFILGSGEHAKRRELIDFLTILYENNEEEAYHYGSVFRGGDIYLGPISLDRFLDLYIESRYSISETIFWTSLSEILNLPSNTFRSLSA